MTDVLLSFREDGKHPVGELLRPVTRYNHERYHEQFAIVTLTDVYTGCSREVNIRQDIIKQKAFRELRR